MRVQPGSFDPEGVPRLTVSSRVIGLVKGSRQPSGTNVFGGVDVSVVIGLATRTAPRPHRQRLAFGHVAAFRTAFGRREPAVNFDDRAACFFRLVLDHPNERRPSGVTDRPSEVLILLHPFHVLLDLIGFPPPREKRVIAHATRNHRLEVFDRYHLDLVARLLTKEIELSFCRVGDVTLDFPPLINGRQVEIRCVAQIGSERELLRLVFKLCSLRNQMVGKNNFVAGTKMDSLAIRGNVPVIITTSTRCVVLSVFRSVLACNLSIETAARLRSSFGEILNSNGHDFATIAFTLSFRSRLVIVDDSEPSKYLFCVVYSVISAFLTTAGCVIALRKTVSAYDFLRPAGAPNVPKSTNLRFRVAVPSDDKKAKLSSCKILNANWTFGIGLDCAHNLIQFRPKE